jgi:hypothetical protein
MHPARPRNPTPVGRAIGVRVAPWVLFSLRGLGRLYLLFSITRAPCRDSIRRPMTETVAFRLANQLKRDLQSAQAIAHGSALLEENMDDSPGRSRYKRAHDEPRQGPPRMSV